MHFFMHNPGGAGLYLPFNAWGWIFASLMICLGLWQATLTQRLTCTPLQVGLWLAGALLLLPMLYPGFMLKDYAIPRLLGLFSGLLFLFSLYQLRLNSAQRERWLYIILMAVFIEALLGLVQYYLLTKGNWIGYDNTVNRPYGIFQQPNVMATFMASGLAMAIFLLLHQPVHGLLRLFCRVVIIACTILLVVLQSRVGQLGGLLVIFFLAPRLYQQRQLWSVLLLLLLAIIIGLVSQHLMAGVSRGLEIYQSGGIRLTYWSYALKLISQAPWSGWGYGSFESVFLQQYMADKMLQPAMVQIEYNLDHPHNEILYWGVEGGLISIIGIILFAMILLWRVMQLSLPNALTLLALLTPILLHTQTEYPFYHAIVIWWLLLILIYIVDCEVEATKIALGYIASWRIYHYPHGLLLRFIAIFIPLGVVPFMLTAIHTAWIVNKYERGGYQEPRLLLDIVNPLAWLTRVEFNINSIRLMVGLQHKDKKELEAYVAWGEAFIRHTPRATIYANMVTALHALARHQEANELRDKALILYPTDPVLNDPGTMAVKTSVDLRGP
ncbi:PglL family O-oligosaccharyltransferase [Aeromonas cavernicola]|uniref:Ligase n=1 Tax=Aeromonas cavernicola TaxID=1006623 RepID=A0A2H9U7U8_9GAMM|nr:Wzy polymerase domain-containing protein [Aeromonas cavernicola]PJG60049.1 ligase [Aeromonas cavernicola]